MLTKQGTITSAAMQDTVTVTVHRHVMHKLYKKSFRKTTRFLVDAHGVEDIRVGDEVRIQECRPLSKRKYFRIVEVLKRTPRVSEMMEEKNVEEAMQRVKQPTEPKKPTKPTSDETHSSKSSVASVASESSVPSPQ
jgi:small subunit ribosomal protein S17